MLPTKEVLEFTVHIDWDDWMRLVTGVGVEGNRSIKPPASSKERGSSGQN